MDIYIIATKGCSHCVNLKRELAELGYECDIKYAEDHPDLVEKFQIRHSPNLVVNDKVVFRDQPAESELKAFFEAL